MQSQHCSNVLGTSAPKSRTSQEQTTCSGCSRWSSVCLLARVEWNNGIPFLGSNSIGASVGRWSFRPIELNSRFSSIEVDNLPIPPDHNGRTGPFSDFNRLKPCIATCSSHFFIHGHRVVVWIGSDHHYSPSKDSMDCHASILLIHSFPSNLRQITSGGVMAPFKTQASSTIGK